MTCLAPERVIHESADGSSSVFYNLIADMMDQHFSHVPLVTRINSGTLSEVELITGTTVRRWRSWNTVLETAYHLRMATTKDLRTEILNVVQGTCFPLLPPLIVSLWVPVCSGLFTVPHVDHVPSQLTFASVASSTWSTNVAPQCLITWNTTVTLQCLIIFSLSFNAQCCQHVLLKAFPDFLN